MSLAEEYGEGAAAAREGENDDYRVGLRVEFFFQRFRWIRLLKGSL